MSMSGYLKTLSNLNMDVDGNKTKDAVIYPEAV
jgi:hypothetical protein